METVVLSSDYQIAIPRSVCERLKLKPGDCFRMIAISGRIELIPLGVIAETRGILKGKDIDSQIEHEADRL